MNVPQQDLDRWCQHANSIREKALRARHRLAGGNREATDDLLTAISELAALVGVQMEQAGARTPDRLPEAKPVPLHLLDTPANRRYLERLREAWEAGLAVDRERYGEEIGTDGEAQVIEMVLRDKEQEVFGPSGARE